VAERFAYCWLAVRLVPLLARLVVLRWRLWVLRRRTDEVKARQADLWSRLERVEASTAGH
jgi:hypothetical protein